MTAPPDFDIPALVGEMAAGAVDQLLELAASEEIAIVRAPRSGLVMMTCRDAFGCDFHLGEVLVSEAEVSCRGRSAYGMVPGADLRRALARAATEVILAGDNRLLQQRLRKLAEGEWTKLQERRREQERLTARTRVRFDLMAGS